MQTPPNNGNARPNFMQFKRGIEGQQQSFRGDNMLHRMAPKYQYKKQQIGNEKQTMTKQMAQMKKQINFLQNTKWMFQNNDMLVTDNFSPNPL